MVGTQRGDRYVDVWWVLRKVQQGLERLPELCHWTWVARQLEAQLSGPEDQPDLGGEKKQRKLEASSLPD